MRICREEKMSRRLKKAVREDVLNMIQTAGIETGKLRGLPAEGWAAGAMDGETQFGKE